MKITKCDICGAEISAGHKSLLIYNENDEYDNTRWEDVCTNCIYQIMELIKSRKRDKA